METKITKRIEQTVIEIRYQNLRQRRVVINIRYPENSFQSFSHKKKGRDAHLLLPGLEECWHMILRCLMAFTSIFASAFTEKSSH